MSQDKSYAYMLRLLMIGDSSVGKTCLLIRFADNTYNDQNVATVGIDFKVKTCTIDDKRIKFQIWDTAGQERFQTVTSNYYKGAMGILVVFDLTKEETFNNVPKWLKNISDMAPNSVYKILVGNKCDDDEKRVISKEQAQELANNYQMPYYETSSKSNINVNEIFYTFARYKIQQMNNENNLMNNNSNNIRLHKQKPQSKSDNNCC